MSQNDSQWIEIFRAGDYSAKNKGVITPADLQRVASSYDPTFHEAPVVVGHPKDNAPAYGWVAALSADGDTLLAKEKQVDPEFNEARKAGRYKKRSASFYVGPDGKISGLRHVGWLGAEPPQVKGLKEVQFNDSRNFVEFGEEDGLDPAGEKNLLEQFKAWVEEKLGRQSVGFSEADASKLIETAVKTATEPLTAKIATLQTELQQQTVKFSEREKSLAGGELKQRVTDAIAGLKSKGKWIPAFDKAGAEVIFSELAKSADTVEFGEGDQKKNVTAFELFVSFMEGLPAIVPAGRQVDPAAAGTARTVNFNEGKGTKADQNSIALSDAATKLAKEKNISFSEALDRVVLEQPELAKPAGANAGAV